MYDIMYDIMISCYDIIYDIICIAFLALYDIVKKLWYHTWYHILKYDIIYDIIKTIIKSLSCAILLWFRQWYHIHFIRFCLWYQKLMILSMISPMIWPSDISNLVYHRPLISQISWYLSLYRGACGTWKLELFQVGKFQVGRNFDLQTWMPITYTALQPKLATYSSLIGCSCWQSSSGLGHSGLLSALRRSQPGRLGITVRPAQPDSHWRCQMAVVYRP